MGGSDDDKEEVAFGEGDAAKQGVEPAVGAEATGDAMQLDGENAGARAEAAGDIQLPMKDTQEGEAGAGSPQDQQVDKGDASSDDDKRKKKDKKKKDKKDKKDKKKKDKKKDKKKKKAAESSDDDAEKEGQDKQMEQVL